MIDSTERQKSRRRWRRFLGFLLVIALFVGGGYLLNLRGIKLGKVYTAISTTSYEAATTAKVKAALALSRTVSAFDIDVNTQGNVVRLSGQVPSQGVKELAVTIAEGTSGVEKVEDNLVINPSAKPDPELERLRGQVADLEAKILVTNALLRNAELAAGNVKVGVENQRVTLSGFVRDPNQKEGAERIARSVEGVAAVVNNISVQQTEQAGPSAPVQRSVARQVEFELFASRAFDLDRIKINAQDGKVTLSGQVRSQAEKLLAERIAAGVDGVQHVASELQVGSASAPESEPASGKTAPKP